MEKEKKVWGNPLIDVQQFVPQSYIASCQWRATLHCGIYGNSEYHKSSGGYWYQGMEHGTSCQNTVVTVRKDKSGNLTVTGQEVPKGSVVTYATAPDFDWGVKGVGAPSSPTSDAIGSLYSYASWNSSDINGTGDYIHLGYVASWQEYPDGTSNVS